MSRKLWWPFSLIVVAGLAVGLARALAPKDRSQELAERLERLERKSDDGRGTTALARRYDTLPALLPTAAPAPEPDDERAPGWHERQQEAEAAQAEKERRHYDRLDILARAGGDVAAATRLRNTIAELRARPQERGRLELDVTALDCSDSLCRVELKLSSSTGDNMIFAAARAFSRGMGGRLSMRPPAGDRAIYYVATPGHELPPMNL